MKEAFIYIGDMKGSTYRDLEDLVEQVQKDAYNQGIYDSADNVQTKQVECFYDGVRSGGSYYIKVIDNQSILKLLK